eukprot:CAMPEP_0113437518 /NCGR_PEP_ID=MMETSP0013_2-20120614/37466_1 /TAXON_ID=2843 ORGANISM="Skeletonema costatum, Strain 1716" /NCGR_SAMPLE_ID=MMETSP0013_2 /ASSEMBLY_ACC=CAM_ASM_000158 /LENGTH=747 /DNA_ID=CAMNT_0000328193 /DNA_START=155 /DNA_END=2395 /DNA_ORIENTATION=+ /assembly_acc=CAM_ASM_000158
MVEQDVAEIDNIQSDDPVFKKSSQLLLEDTYFLYGHGDTTNTLNTAIPTLPSIEVFPQQQWPNHNASVSPVQAAPTVTSNPVAVAPPVDPPTLSPSMTHQAANGGCPPEHKLHRLWLYDSYGDAQHGDGWGTTTLQIREQLSFDVIFEGTLDAELGAIRYAAANDASMVDGHAKNHDDQRRRLEDTSEDNGVYICLDENACYVGEILGGTFTEECSWELTKVELETGNNVGLVAKGVGGGLGKCEFGLTDSCVHSCDGTVQTNQPTKTPTTLQPSKSPTISPSGEPSESPTRFKTKRPTMPLAPEVLPQDILYGVDELNRVKNILLSASPTSGPALMDPSSPQSEGFAWIYNQRHDLSDEELIQRWVLASFYYGTNGDDWVVKDGWLTSQSECSWYGVSCLNGAVSKLELEQNRLAGFLVPEIALWKKDLYVISLGNDYDAPSEEKNTFVMPLPSVLGELTYLKFLNLEHVGLVSSIPEGFFMNLSHLQSLYLNNNAITGFLPRSIRHLSSIEVLWLGGNNMDGPIISEIGHLTSLKDLSLEDNFREDSSGNRGFVAALPSEIGSLTNLEILSLADNALSGQLPLQMGDLISLRQLRLRNNFFENQLPTVLGKLELLEVLDISHNWLSSTIPPEYGNMVGLTTLSLESNYRDQNGYFTWGINGELPIELGKLKNLQHLRINDNYLTGTLISEIGQLFLLETLHLQNNFLQGPIPEVYSNCVMLKEVLLEDNSIDSQFGMPEGICRLP